MSADAGGERRSSVKKRLRRKLAQYVISVLSNILLVLDEVYKSVSLHNNFFITKGLSYRESWKWSRRKMNNSTARISCTISHVLEIESVNILVVQSHQSVLLPVDTKMFKKTRFVCLGAWKRIQPITGTHYACFHKSKSNV